MRLVPTVTGKAPAIRVAAAVALATIDRKSTRLNSSH